jgi:acyl-coenzyme A thioesterase PaaI-like protein
VHQLHVADHCQRLRQHDRRRNHCGHAGEAFLMAWAVLSGLLGFDWTHLRRGETRGRLDAQKHHLAPTVLLHAATIVALADTACRCGCLHALPDGASGPARAPSGTRDAD